MNGIPRGVYVAQSGQIWVAWVAYYVIYEQFTVMAILKMQGLWVIYC